MIGGFDACSHLIFICGLLDLMSSAFFGEVNRGPHQYGDMALGTIYYYDTKFCVSVYRYYYHQYGIEPS